MPLKVNEGQYKAITVGKWALAAMKETAKSHRVWQGQGRRLQDSLVVNIENARQDFASPYIAKMVKLLLYCTAFILIDRKIDVT